MVPVSRLSSAGYGAPTLTVGSVEVPETSWLEMARDEGLACIMIAGRVPAAGPVCIVTTVDPVARLKEMQLWSPDEVAMHDSLWFPDRAIAARVEKDAWRMLDIAEKRTMDGGRWVGMPPDWARATVAIAARNLKIGFAGQEAVRTALARGWARKNYGRAGLDGIEGLTL